MLSADLLTTKLIKMINITEEKLRIAIQMCLSNNGIYTEKREANLVHDIKALGIADVSGMLPNQTKRHIDLAYLTGVFNVVGIDGLQKELTRLKKIGKNPHDLFSEGNYR